jgi:AraC-like DNA-binding protein
MKALPEILPQILLRPSGITSQNGIGSSAKASTSIHLQNGRNIEIHINEEIQINISIIHNRNSGQLSVPIMLKSEKGSIVLNTGRQTNPAQDTSITGLIDGHTQIPIYIEDDLDNNPNTYPCEPDVDLISKVNQIIRKHLNNSDFGTARLCKELGISRTQLHNKLKTLTGRSTALYIRLIRLIEARKWLVKTTLNVSEIAYDAGFKDPNYFSRIFTREFGVNPTQFRLNAKPRESKTQNFFYQ